VRSSRLPVRPALVVTALLSFATPAAAQTGRCEAGEGGRCGTVAVPLDRAAPGAGTTRIAYELYPARRPARRLGTVLAIPDGPGFAATTLRDAYLDVLAPLRARFDVLLVDRRGTGGSRPIDCAALQRGRGPAAAAIAACGAQLGAAADRYGTADVAHDVEAVREALGRSRLDLYGTAYGAVDALAYAVRYPARVRSLVLASPVTPLARDALGAPQVAAFVRAVSGYCRRSRACATTEPNPRAVLDRLVARLRLAPVRGDGIDRAGALRRVTLDEARLAEMARNTRGDMITHGELTAAARALLDDDDPAPILRLAAHAAALPGDREVGPAGEGTSLGALTAALCTDGPLTWDPAAARALRLGQFGAARAARAPGAFAPFSAAAWTAGFFGRWDGAFDLVGSLTAGRTGPCVDWPAPDRAEAPVPAGAALPAMPALVLSSDTSVHSPMEEADALAAALPAARRVLVRGMDHVPALVEPCVAAIVRRFLRTLRPGDTDCAPDPGGPWLAPGVFPATASQALPARVDPRGANAVGRRGRRVAAAAVGAVVDAYYHGSPEFRRTRALRGGFTTTRVTDDGERATIRLREARFARDVAVTGAIRIDFAGGQRWRGRLTVRGGALGGRRATLDVAGQFYSVPDRPVRVRGRIAGRTARLLVDVY
jgi:pimeloyl-ACP methyl ester carboxylesterase